MEIASIKAVCKRCGQEFGYEVPKINGMWSNFLHRDYCYPCIEIIDMKEQHRLETAHKQRLEQDRIHMFTTCGVPFKYRQAEEELEGFDWRDNAKAKTQIAKYLREYPAEGKPVGYPSMLLCSRHYGVGKTRLVCAIIRELLQVWKEDARDVSPYRFWSMPDVIVALQQGQRFGSEKSTQDIYQELSACRLLVLDDVGKETKRDYGDAYYKIINDRYNAQLPMIVTANQRPSKPWITGGQTLDDAIGAAAVSRLKEMCQGNIIEIKGDDRR